MNEETNEGKVTHAPQGTQTKSALFASDTVVSLVDVVPIYKALNWRRVSRFGRVEHQKGRTFDVRPPLSGLLSTALRVLTNLGSDGFIKNTSGIIMTLESNTCVSSYDCPKICRSLFHAFSMICS